MNGKDQQIESGEVNLSIEQPHRKIIRQVLVVVTMTVVVIFSFSNSSQAESRNRECFQTHLREARALNEARKPLYARVSRNRSLEISNKLIEQESLVIFWGPIFADFDQWAIPYQQHVLEIICDDFVSMHNTPTFAQQRPGPHPALRKFRNVPAGELRLKLARALRHGFQAVEAETETMIKELNSLFLQADQMNCMTRHLLESIRRIARNAPRYVFELEQINRKLPATRRLASPAWISQKMIEGHFQFLTDAEALDRAAAALQAEGIPIICNDVPPIP